MIVRVDVRKCHFAWYTTYSGDGVLAAIISVKYAATITQNVALEDRRRVLIGVNICILPSVDEDLRTQAVRCRWLGQLARIWSNTAKKPSRASEDLLTLAR